MPDNKTRMKTKTAKYYGLKTLGSPFMLILLAIIIYFGYMSFDNPAFLELFIILLGFFILWPLLNVFSVSKKDVILTDQAIIVRYEKTLKEDKTIPLDQVKEITIRRSLIGDWLNWQDLIIVKESEERDIITGISDGEMLVNMVKQIAEEKAMEQAKKEAQSKPIKEDDFNFTNHN